MDTGWVLNTSYPVSATPSEIGALVAALFAGENTVNAQVDVSGGITVEFHNGTRVQADPGDTMVLFDNGRWASGGAVDWDLDTAYPVDGTSAGVSTLNEALFTAGGVSTVQNDLSGVGALFTNGTHVQADNGDHFVVFVNGSWAAG